MILSYLSVFLGVLLLAVPAGLLYVSDPSSLRRLAVALGRMVLQLAVAGVLLWVVFRVDAVWLTALWLLLVSALSAWVVVRRARLRRSRLLLPVAGATFVTLSLFTLYVVFGVLRPSSPLSARWVVPVAAVLSVQLLPGQIRSLHAFYEELRVNSLPYYTAVGNGVSRLKALLPYLGHALAALVVPVAASLSVTGLFVIPLLLSGLLLGGVQPVEAVVSVVLLIFASISASVTSVALSLLLADRNTFDRRGNYWEAQPLADAPADSRLDEGQTD